MIISSIETKTQSIKIFICLEFFGKINFFSQSHTSRIHTYSFNDIASFKKKQINIYISIAVDSGRHIHGTINNIFIISNWIKFIIKSYRSTVCASHGNSFHKRQTIVDTMRKRAGKMLSFIGVNACR